MTHVVASLAREKGGPSYSVPALSRALERLEVNSVVRAVRERDAAGCQSGSANEAGILHARNRGPSALLEGSRALRQALASDARGGTIIHAHGLWLLPNLYPAWIKSKDPRVKVIHAPRGMLATEALRISPWKKQPVWWLWQRDALRASDCLHATALSEYREIRARGLSNPVAVVPNGIEVEPLPDGPPIRKRMILYLGRIHPKKALDQLALAWSRLEMKYPDWSVSIVGPAEVGYDEALRRLCEDLKLQRLAIKQPVFGDEKRTLYQSAALFVLPSLNENFGNAVAEALASAVPVVSTKGAPWAGLEAERCGWWIDHGVNALAAALEAAINTDPAEREAMGARGRAWMARDFGWDRIARDMRSVYMWLKHGGAVPANVYLD